MHVHPVESVAHSVDDDTDRIHVQDRNVDDGSCSVHTGGESFPSVWRSV